MKKVFRELTSSADSSFIVKQEKASQFGAPYHFHRGYEFTYIIKGRGKFYGGDRLLNFSEGNLYLLGPGFAHYFVNEKSFVLSGEKAHSIIVQFTEDFLGKELFYKPEFKKILELLKLSFGGIIINNPDKKMHSLLTEITQKKGVKSLLVLFELLDKVSLLKKNQLTIIGNDKYKTDTGDTDFSKLDAVYKYILEGFTEDITSKKAAALAFLNEAAFCRYFKRRTKKTFSQFVNDVRITHATYLLSEKDISVSAVCYESGFNNFSYFNRQFKALTGKTPLEYRKEYSRTYY